MSDTSSSLVTIADPRSPVSEAFRTLCLSVLGHALGANLSRKPSRVIH